MAVAVLGSSCARSSAPPLPPAPATVAVGMREYAFDHAPLVPAGRAVFKVQNTGRVDHELYLVGLAPEGPPIGELFTGGSGSPQLLQPLAYLPSRGPGAKDSFAYDVGPGRYGFVCLAKDADGKTHAGKGMSSQFRVPERAGQPVPSSPQSTGGSPRGS